MSNMMHLNKQLTELEISKSPVPKKMLNEKSSMYIDSIYEPEPIPIRVDLRKVYKDLPVKQKKVHKVS